MSKKLDRQRQELLDSVTLQEYQLLNNKFCSQKPQPANFINVQVSQVNKKPKERRFSEIIKRECLTMYFTSPHLYKTKLMNMFCLPSPSLLFRYIKKVKFHEDFYLYRWDFF